MDSFKAFEAATLQAGIAPPPTNIPPDDGDGDGEDQWEFENVRKRFWDGLSKWAQNSPTANVVRFNIYETMIRKTRAKAHSMIWGSQGDSHTSRKMVKSKQGYARAYLEWTLPMEGMLWDKIVEQQRSVLTKSDVYKAFGEEGRVGSAALLFKGDVLECVVYLCCAITPGAWDYRTNLTGSAVDPFTSNMLKLVQSKFGSKLEKWLRENIVQKLRKNLVVNTNTRGNELLLPNLKLEPMDTKGRTQAYDGSLALKMDQGFRISW